MQRLRRCASVARALRGASSRVFAPSVASQVRCAASRAHPLLPRGFRSARPFVRCDVACEAVASCFATRFSAHARPLWQASSADVQGLRARGFAAAPDVAPADDDPRPVEMKGVSMSGKPLYLDMQARSLGSRARRHLCGD